VLSRIVDRDLYRLTERQRARAFGMPDRSPATALQSYRRSRPVPIDRASASPSVWDAPRASQTEASEQRFYEFVWVEIDEVADGFAEADELDGDTEFGLDGEHDAALC
jgi:hypothetical protein